MAQGHCQLTFSASSNRAKWNGRCSQPPQGPDPVFPVFPLQSFRPPAYQYHNNYSYFLNPAPPIMRLTGGNNGYQHQITNLETSDVVWMQHGGYVQEDDTWVLNGVGQETDGYLSEEVVSKCLKTRNGNHEVAKEKDEEPKICVVCQNNLCQKNKTIGVLRCGHQYHAGCIKKWLLRKNICPLCKASAIVCRR